MSEAKNRTPTERNPESSRVITPGGSMVVYQEWINSYTESLRLRAEAAEVECERLILDRRAARGLRLSSPEEAFLGIVLVDGKELAIREFRCIICNIFVDICLAG